MDSIGFNKKNLFNYTIKINAHKIKHQPQNRRLCETIIPRKQIKINTAVHFLTNPILNDEIKKELKDQKQKKNILYQLVNLSNM
jgi:hypothetical protein